MAQPNRSEQRSQSPSTPVLAELLRVSTGQGQCEDGKEDKMPMFWRIFGSTVLSITALVLVTAYQALSGSMTELRNDMAALNNEMRKEFSRLTEGQSELVKADEAASRIQSVSRDVNDLKEDKKELIALKERCETLSAMRKESEQERRKLAAELQALREQRVQQEERRAMADEVAKLRERLAGLEGKQGSAPPVPMSEGKKVGLGRLLGNAIGAITGGLTEKEDINARINRLLQESEDLRKVEEEWTHFWKLEQVSPPVAGTPPPTTDGNKTQEDYWREALKNGIQIQF